MLKIFTVVGFLEGLSYLALFFNMLVIKNTNIELYEKILFPLGMAHGLLVVLYIVMAIMLKIELKWSFKKFILICIASLIPFGTFYSEKNWLYKDIK